MPRTRRRFSPDERKRQLVSLAIERIADEGVDGYSLEDIAESADVSRVLVYRYFPRGKRDLSLEAIRSVLEQVALTIADPTVPLETKRVQNNQHIISIAFGSGPSWRVYRQAALSTDPEISRIVDDYHQQYIEGLALNNDLDASDPMVALGLRSYVAFGSQAIDEALKHGISPAVVMEFIMVIFDSILSCCREMASDAAPAYPLAALDETEGTGAQ